ncbi:tetratricopeptide repeat protein, partial [Candidatus Saganbacteria bacterium]|nr:tetratricopeptide repeat protein [Candidatus Saganbacteria bacterium]
IREKPLLAVISGYGGREIVAFCGWETRTAYSGRKEEIRISFGQEHNQSGFDYFMRGMFQAAEEEFSLAVQLDREAGAALNNLGVTLIKEGKLEEARLRLNEAVQADPASAIFYNNLGVAYFLAGKTDLAGTALEKSRALDDGSSAVCLNLGDLYYKQSVSDAEVMKAIELYRKVGAVDPLSDIAAQRLMHKVP